MSSIGSGVLTPQKEAVSKQEAELKSHYQKNKLVKRRWVMSSIGSGVLTPQKEAVSKQEAELKLHFQEKCKSEILGGTKAPLPKEQVSEKAMGDE